MRYAQYWDNEIVISSIHGDHKATPVYAGQPIYFDYAFINNSDVNITSSFQTYLYIDGAQVDSKTTSSLSAHSGNLVLAYNKAEVIETEEQISIGQSDLCWLERQMGTDLAISEDDVNFSPANPVPGEECTITAIIHNLGDLAVENVGVAFYDGNPEEGELYESSNHNRCQRS